MRVHLAAGPGGQALSRSMDMKNPLRRSLSESFSDRRGTANGWSQVTLGLWGRPSPRSAKLHASCNKVTLRFSYKPVKFNQQISPQQLQFTLAGILMLYSEDIAVILRMTSAGAVQP